MTATATAAKPHPLYLADKNGQAVRHSLKAMTGQTCRELNWSAAFAYANGKAGWQGRVGGKLVAVTWKGYFLDDSPFRQLVVETHGVTTVFTVEERKAGRTRMVESFACPSDVNHLFLTAIDPADPYTAPLADYLMERGCPADILAFFW